MAEIITQSSPYIGLARRYRPQTFADVVGQDQVARSLAQQVTQGRIAQAYIFSGPRGIGKTSTARILAKSLNCAEGPTAEPCGKCDQCRSIQSGNSMDVIEIDGASNRGIDDIRDLQESISQTPFAARKKIYIIDEVHMLTREAFNALLKTLEEPPPFVIFVFATTEFERIPETIKSRCQAFMFNRISMEDIVRRLDYVADREGIRIDAAERLGIFEAIAFAVDGGMRDAMMALDQLAALSDGAIRIDEATRFLGVVEHDLLIRTVEMLHQRDSSGLLRMVNDLVERGRDLERFVKNLLGFLRDLMIVKAGGGKDLVNLTGDKMARAQSLLWEKDETGRQSEVISYPELLNFMQVFLALEGDIKEAVQVRIHVEFAFVKLTAIEPVVDINRLLSAVESGKASGRPQRPAPAEAPPAVAPEQAPAPASPPPRPATQDLFGGARRASTQALDGPALWNLLQENRQRLGMSLSMALKDCRFGGFQNDCLTLQIAKRSVSVIDLEAPEKRARLEAWLSETAGRRITIRLDLLDAVPAARPAAAAVSRTAPRPAAMPEPAAVLRDIAPAETGREEADSAFEEADSVFEEPDGQDSAETDAYAIYLKRDPVARARDALSRSESFREKVTMVRDFFGGRVLDPSGKEIAL